jgi:hypothetical protein
VREGLDFIVSFTLIGAAAIVVAVAITVGIFLIIRRRSQSDSGRAESIRNHR